MYKVLVLHTVGVGELHNLPELVRGNRTAAHRMVVELAVPHKAAAVGVLHMGAAEEDNLVVVGGHHMVVAEEGIGARHKAAEEELHIVAGQEVLHMEVVEEGNLAAHHMAVAEEGMIVVEEDTVVVHKVGLENLDSD